MPFRSKRQSRLFFATMPDIAKEWAHKTDYSKIPERVRKKKKNDCNDRPGERALQMATEYDRAANNDRECCIHGMSVSKESGCRTCGYDNVKKTYRKEPPKELVPSVDDDEYGHIV
jgi:hypothetical protein